MLRFSPLLPPFVALVLAVGLTPARADDAASVKKKLDQAKTDYDQEVEKFNKALLDWLELREADARKAGNRKLVDQVKAERAAFEKRRELPPSCPKGLVAKVKAARATLSWTYTAAAKEYIGLKAEDAAEAAEKERQEFLIASGFTFGKKTPLATLKPFNVKTAKDGFTPDFTLKLKEEVPHCVRTDPPSEGLSQVSYQLAGKWAALRVRVGVPSFPDTAQAPASKLTFEVLGDGKLLWSSKPTNKLDEFQTCEVAVERMKVLTLRVDCQKSNDWARACWLEPILAD